MRTAINRDSISNAKLKETIGEFDTILLTLGSRLQDAAKLLPVADAYTNKKDIIELRKNFLIVLQLLSSFDETKLRELQAEIDKFYSSTKQTFFFP